jgi:hypothetical protein
MATTNSPERPADVAVDAYLVNATMRPRHDVAIVDGTPARCERACDQVVAHVKADFDTAHCYRACHLVNGLRSMNETGEWMPSSPSRLHFCAKTSPPPSPWPSAGADLHRLDWSSNRATVPDRSARGAMTEQYNGFRTSELLTAFTWASH